jgi:conjugal transfer pilus assembly protein TraK
LIALITLASSIAASDALALQDIEVTPDGMSMARISLHEATRIRVDGQPITQIYGSGIQDAKSNPSGSLIVQPLENRGEVSVLPAQGVGEKPISVFVDTAKSTYTLVLIPAETPSETIVLHDRRKANPAANRDDSVSTKRASNYYREIKRFVLILEGSEEASDLTVKPAHEVIGLWPEARFILTERISGDETMRGERYLLTNVSAQPMRIDEREFYTSDVIAVSIEKAELAPQESTAVYIVREADHAR